MDGKIIQEREKYMNINQNSAFITGTIVSPYYLTCATTEDGHCYKVFISARRFSGTEDVIPAIVPERCLRDTIDGIGRSVTAKGVFRSMDRYSNGKHHLDLFLYVDEFIFGERNTGGDEIGGVKDRNRLSLEGYIGKPPVYRKTPLGRRIADFILAVNSPDPRHPNYIPCIAWGEDAVLASRMQAGDHIRLAGRIQSREYSKVLHGKEGDTVQKRIAYEVSCRSLEVLEDKGGKRSKTQADEEASPLDSRNRRFQYESKAGHNV